VRTILKPLKEWYGKTDDHNGRYCGGFHVVGPMKENLKERRLSSDEEVIGAAQNWLRTQPRNFISDGIKKNCETLELVR
jgi:hypothetical protein